MTLSLLALKIIENFMVERVKRKGNPPIMLVRKGIAITSRRNHSYFYRVGTGRRGTCGAGDPLSTS